MRWVAPLLSQSNGSLLISDAGQFLKSKMYCTMNVLRQKLLPELDYCHGYVTLELRWKTALKDEKRIKGKTGYFSSFHFVSLVRLFVDWLNWRTTDCLSVSNWQTNGPTDGPTDVPTNPDLLLSDDGLLIFQPILYVSGLLDLPLWHKARPGKLGWARQRCVLQRSIQLFRK